MKSNMFVLALVVLLVLCCLLPAFFRWKKHRKALRERLLSRLSSRSERLLYSLEMISDRYLTKETNVFFLEYLLYVIGQLKNANYQSKFVSKQGFLVDCLTELKSGRQQVTRDRVGSQEQFDQVCDALQYILREMRNIPENRVVSRVIVKHHIVLVRYAHALAYRDLLVKQAGLDLENDKKGLALEKYRIALSSIEKNRSVSSSKREIVRLQNMIQDVEKVLFSKRDKTESELK
ncbi:hypothetical protein M3I01_012140 [Marinomonas sp. RSW2]|uniref:Uncharacterized protein n=1 Tax=Marinomonas maritima TaxID=2940935 RepID=A0ABT5WFP7_9GAMM|nr:hypothetical protein [Marinomonas maritima]MDE8603643.1 hypothetical protein [Marinomonas maritima]